MTTNERVIVLNLLREGKIGTDDAERLLAALSEPKDRGKRARPEQKIEEAFKRVEREFRTLDFADLEKKIAGFFDDLRKRFSEMSWESSKGKKTPDGNVIEGSAEFDIADGATLRLSQKGGEVNLVPTDSKRLKVSAPLAHAEFADEKRRASVEAVGGLLEAAVPSQVKRVYVEATGCKFNARDVSLDGLTVRVVGGTIRATGVSGDLRLSSVGGGLQIEHVASTDIDAETNGGSLLARLGDTREGAYRFAAAGGGATVELGADSDFELEYSVSAGVFDSQWDSTPVGKNRLRVGEGRAKLQIVAHGGSIALWQGA